MNEKIKNLLNNTEKLLALAEKVRGKADEIIVKEFHETLNSELDLWVANEAATNVWEALYAATFVPEEGQKDAMIEATEEATAIVGDWTEEAAKLAQRIWETKLGLERPQYLSYRELFDNSDLPESLKMEGKLVEADGLTSVEFVKEGVTCHYPCLKGSTFPVGTAELAYIGLKSAQKEGFDSDLKTTLEEEAASYGFKLNSVSVLESAGIHLVWVDKNWTEENTADIIDQYELSEEDAAELELQVETAVEMLSTEGYAENLPVPLSVQSSSIVKKFAEQENQTDYLAPLVGLVRTLGISKEKFEDASKTYNCFGVTVLQKLLERAFAVPSTIEENGSDDAQPDSQIPTLSNPVAKPTSGEAGKPSPIKSSLDLAFTPINRRSLKNKKNTK